MQIAPVIVIAEEFGPRPVVKTLDRRHWELSATAQAVRRSIKEFDRSD